MIDVSIIIVNWNTRELLANCLSSIYEETLNIHFEIIVVDNNSSDGSVAMLETRFPEVKLISNNANLGLAAGINQGLSLASGKYVLLLNSDTLICEKAIEKTMEFAEKNPDAGVIGCQVLDSKGRITMTCFAFPSLWNLFSRLSGLSFIFRQTKLFGRERMLWWDRTSQRNVDVVSGSFMFIRRDVMDKAGGMDKGFFLYYEETDLCYRLAQLGRPNIYWPGAQIIHVHGGRQSSSRNAGKMFVEFHKSMLRFFKKHYGNVSYFIAWIMLLVSSLMRCVINLIATCISLVFRRNSHYHMRLTSNYWKLFKYCLTKH